MPTLHQLVTAMETYLQTHTSQQATQAIALIQESGANAAAPVSLLLGSGGRGQFQELASPVEATTQASKFSQVMVFV